MTPSQRRIEDDRMYDPRSQSPLDRQQGRRTDRTRHGDGEATRIDAFKSAIQASSDTALQVQVDATKKAWSNSVAREATEDHYFALLRQSEPQGGQFVARSMVRTGVDRCDLQPAVERGDAQVHGNDAEQQARCQRTGRGGRALSLRVDGEVEDTDDGASRAAACR